MLKKSFLSLLVIMTLTTKSQTPLSPYIYPNIDFKKFYSQTDAVVSSGTALDVNSSVYQTGYSGLSSSANLIVLKYDSLGVLSYSYAYNNGGFDNGSAIKVGPLGNAFICGSSVGTSTTGIDYIVVKLNANGTLAWTRRFDRGTLNPSNNTDEANDVCIDPSSGHVYVTGRSRNAAGNYDIVTLKLNGGTGAIMWTHVFNGSSSLDDSGIGIVLSPSGTRIYITGNTTNSTTGLNIVTYALNASTGAILWGPMIANGSANGSDKANDIITLGNDLVVCGEITNTGTGLDYFLRRYNGTTGATMFNQTYDFAGSSNRATALVRDSAGNLGVTGIALNGTIYEYHTLLYSPLGSLNATNRESTGLTTLTVTPKICNDTIAHHYYVSGEALRATKDMFVYQVTPTGTTSWKQFIDGLNTDADCATGIAVNGVGVVYVGGRAKNSSANFDFATVKINQTPAYIPVTYNLVPDSFSYSNLYYPNTGEILNTSLTTATNVLYYTKFTSQNQYVLKDRIAYCEIHSDTSITKNDTLSRVDMIFSGANTLTEIYPLNYQKKSYLNYYLSHTGVGGKTNVQGASNLMIPNIYPYIDLHCTSNKQGSKYFFVLKPGAKPQSIRIQFAGAKSTSITNEKLKINSAFSSWSFNKPKIYNVAVNYTTYAISTPSVAGANGWSSLGSNIYGINAGTYNTALPLVIEITQGVAQAITSTSLNLYWSTYVGSAGDDEVYNIKSDAGNNLYTIGGTTSSNFPLVTGVGVFQSVFGGSSDGYIDKYLPTGQRDWSTFVGGTNNDYVAGIDFAPNGDLYVVGHSTSILTTYSKSGAYNFGFPQGYGDGFIFQFNSNGQIPIWLTYYGGYQRDHPNACKFDSQGNFFVVGYTYSNNIPIVGSAPQYTQTNNDPAINQTEGFIVKFNTSSIITWATYLGATTNTTFSNGATDVLTDLAFNSLDYLFVVGQSLGSNYPQMTNIGATSFSCSSSLSSDGVISQFLNSGEMIWSTCVGGGGFDYCRSIKINSANMYITGTADDAPFQFPVLNSGNYYYRGTSNGLSDAYLMIFDDFGLLNHSTYLGSTSTEIGYDVDVDAIGKVYVSGITRSTGFPSPISQPPNVYTASYLGNCDYFLYALTPGNINLRWATDIGGTDDEGFLSGTPGVFLNVDGQNNLTLAGSSKSSSLFPVYNGTTNINGIPYYDATHNGNKDVTITRFNLGPVNFLGLPENRFVTKGLTVYPNPTQSSLNIQLEEYVEEKAYFYIYNMMGQLVQMGAIEKELSTINLSNLTQGLYVLDIKSNTRHSSIKFIKNE